MANRTVNQLPGTLDHTTIAGADKLLVDDVSDAETKSIIVDEAALAFAPKSKLDATAAPDDAVDNEAAGYRTGSLWLWAAQSRIWVYLVVTPGTSAGWLELKEGSQSAAEELTDAVGSSPVVGDLVRVATGVYGVRQTNLGTTVDPTVDDDENAEYSGGSLWVNKANGSVWICTDPTLGAAVWRRIDRPQTSVRTVTTNTVLTADDQVVIVDASGGPITLTAPDPADLYEPILILKKSTGANAINVATPSGQINGAASPQALPDSTSTLRPSWTLLTDGTDTWSA